MQSGWFWVIIVAIIIWLWFSKSGNKNQTTMVADTLVLSPAERPRLDVGDVADGYFAPIYEVSEALLDLDGDPTNLADQIVNGPDVIIEDPITGEVTLTDSEDVQQAADYAVDAAIINGDLILNKAAVCGWIKQKSIWSLGLGAGMLFGAKTLAGMRK